eukprot:gene37562-49162_t
MSVNSDEELMERREFVETAKARKGGDIDLYVSKACSLRCTAGLTIRDRLDSMIALLQLVGLGGAIFRIAIIPLIQVGWIQLGRASISKVLGRLIFRMAKIAWIQ